MKYLLLAFALLAIQSVAGAQHSGRVTLQQQEQTQITNEGIKVALDSYRKQSSAGLGTAAVGMALVFTTYFIQTKYNNDYTAAYNSWSKSQIGDPPAFPKTVHGGLPLIGVGLTTIGFVIHLDAGRYLRHR